MPGIGRPQPALIYFDGSPEGLVDAEFNTICIDQCSPTIWRKTTPLHNLTGWIVITQPTFRIMPNGDAHIAIEQSDGTLKETVISKGTSGFIGFDANGNFGVLSAAVQVPKAGKVAVAATDTNAGTKAVVFAAAFPTGTTYVVEIQFNGITETYQVPTASQLLTGFTFTYLPTITGTAYWTATPITG